MIEWKCQTYALNERYIGSGMFIDLKNAFDTDRHDYYCQNLTVMVSEIFQITDLDLLYLITNICIYIWL